MPPENPLDSNKCEKSNKSRKDAGKTSKRESPTPRSFFQRRQASPPPSPKESSRKPDWYSPIRTEPGFPDSDRTVFAIRGVLPRFSRSLLTIRIVHLFNTPSSAHFPDCPESTHHLFVHNRLLDIHHEPAGKPDIVLSLQFELVPTPSFFHRLSAEERQALEDHFPDLGEKEKGANYIAHEIGRAICDVFLPSVEEQWRIQRIYDPGSRFTDHPRLSAEEHKKSPLRLEGWVSWIEYTYRLLLDRYSSHKEEVIEIRDGRARLINPDTENGS